VKCGVYLQDNDREWGGGITLVPGGHKFPVVLPNLKLTFGLKTLYNHLGIRTKERWADIKAGDFLAFDSRLPHESSFPARFTLADLVNGELPLPSARTKYVLYWDACATGSHEGYLRNSERRAQSEIFFCDYVRLEYPRDFPPEFVETVRRAGVRIASVPSESRHKWEDYYNARFNVA
jgi:hypothetical protein